MPLSPVGSCMIIQISEEHFQHKPLCEYSYFGSKMYIGVAAKLYVLYIEVFHFPFMAKQIAHFCFEAFIYIVLYELSILYNTYNV